MAFQMDDTEPTASHRVIPSDRSLSEPPAPRHAVSPRPEAPSDGLDRRSRAPDPSAPATVPAPHAPRRTAAPRRPGFYRRTLKRGADIAVVAMALPFVVPIVALLALLVMRDGGRPFYCHDRVGRGGRPYRMWKLRTMVHDADARLEAHLRANPVARAEWASKQKLIDDPRITPLGRLLRKSSLDELPQLWNVARGEMSLVGPRPMMLSQQRLYPGRDYYQLRPGITGLWQISDRNAATFADRAKFDTVYNRTLSVGLDLGILLSTVRVVVRGTGH